MEEYRLTSTPMNQKEKFYKEYGANKVYEGYYKSFIGCIMYRTTIRPDVSFVVSLLSMHIATEMYLRTGKII